MFKTLQSRAVLGDTQFLTPHMRAVLVDWMVEVRERDASCLVTEGDPERISQVRSLRGFDGLARPADSSPLSRQCNPYRAVCREKLSVSCSFSCRPLVCLATVSGFDEQVAFQFRLSTIALHAAVSALDVCLGKVAVPRCRLQLLGVVCAMIQSQVSGRDS